MAILKRADGESIAYTKIEPAASQPTLVWLSGFNSDMSGSKALAVKALAESYTIHTVAPISILKISIEHCRLNDFKNV